MKGWTLIGSVALSLALAFGACGGDDDETGDAGAGDAATAKASRSAESTESAETASVDAESPSATAAARSSPTPSATSGGSPSATATASADSGGGSNPGSSDDAIEEFEGLTANTENERYHVIYSVNSTTEGEAQTGTWELTQDPPRSAAVVSYGGEEEGQLFVIDDGTESFTCFSSGDEGQCIKGSAGTDLTGISPDDAVDDLEDGESVEEIEGRWVAGRNARCFQFVGNVPEDSGIICIDEDTGVMLLLEGEDVKIEATRYDQVIDESAFEPPYDVIG